MIAGLEMQDGASGGPGISSPASGCAHATKSMERQLAAEYNHAMSESKCVLPSWYRGHSDHLPSFYCIAVNTVHGFGIDIRATAPIGGCSTWLRTWLSNHATVCREMDLRFPTTALAVLGDLPLGEPTGDVGPKSNMSSIGYANDFAGPPDGVEITLAEMLERAIALLS